MASRLLLRINAKQYATPGGAFQALGRCHVEVAAGEVMAILGPSGCGKTTLVRLIVGLDTNFDGEIYVGDSLVKGPGRDRGIVFQEPRLLPWKSALKNVEFGIESKHNKREARLRAEHALGLVGLSAFADRWPKELSGGMAQRVALARALVNMPEVLVLDEPLGALDMHTRIAMQEELLRVIKSSNTTCLIVTHDVDEAIVMADRIALMSGHPGSFAKVIAVDLPHPRSRATDQFSQLRAQIFAELLAHAFPRTIA